jgi:hypothetical protein
MTVFPDDESQSFKDPEPYEGPPPSTTPPFADEDDDDWCQFADVTEVISEEDVGESDAGEGGNSRHYQELPDELLQRPSPLMDSPPTFPRGLHPPSSPSALLTGPGCSPDSSSPSAAVVHHPMHATPTPASFRFDEMPPQLHPAVSLGVRRVSSCYLSLHSQESVTDLLSQLGEGPSSVGNDGIGNGHNGHRSARFNTVPSEDGDNCGDCRDHSRTAAEAAATNSVQQAGPYFEQSTSDVLYHDILMDVFTFLDAPSLAAFSESARRPNFEVFYFLQLQLQQALLFDEKNDDDDDVDSGSIGSSGTDQEEDGESTTTDGVVPPPVGESDGDNHIDIDEVVVQQREQQRYDRARSTIAGCASLSRLAGMNLPYAREIVQEYLESNSTLRTMPLSHSLAYARHFLQRHGFVKMFPATNNRSTSAQTLASAALFMTVVGAASIVSTVGGTDAAASMASLTDSFGSELPNVLFRVGFVGSLMGAARQMSDTEQRAAMRERAEHMARSAEQMARSMQERMMMRGNRGVDDNSTRESNRNHHQSREETSLQSPSGVNVNFRLPSLFEMRIMLQETMFAARSRQHDRQPVLSDPYDHLPQPQEGEGDGDEYEQEGEEKKAECMMEKTPPAATRGTIINHSVADRKMPSGCVGAYSRAIHKANIHIARSVKESRKSKFEAMSPVDRQHRSLDFLSACSSNDSLDRVKEMIGSLDVDGFFVGNDGSETCALHTASFHGADKVVDFLCAGIDDHDPRRDGGLCQVNLRDSNGWTALHFAAGANSVAVVHVLVKHGAKLKEEAHNGYTPLQWALRLSNEEVADELTKILSTSGADRGAWMSSQPLTSIANRFFSLIPSH